MGLYAVLDIAAIWPYNASNAAVPLAAVLLGHLPQTASDQVLVKALGFAVFLLAFVPLIFGGTVYRMLEKIMTAKLVLVLGYLSIIAVAMVSWPVISDVAAGFFGFGTRAAAGRDDRPRTPLLARVPTTGQTESVCGEPGNRTAGRPATCSSTIGTEARRGTTCGHGERDHRPRSSRVSDSLLAQAGSSRGPAASSSRPGQPEPTLEAEGADRQPSSLAGRRACVHRGKHATLQLRQLVAVPEPYASRFRNLLDHEGVEYVGTGGLRDASTGGFPASTGRWSSRSSASPGLGG